MEYCKYVGQRHVGDCELCPWASKLKWAGITGCTKNLMVKMAQTVGFRVAFWHQPRCVWCRWLNHLVLVIVGGAQGWVWELFGKQPEGFWIPVRAHMGPTRKRLAMKAAPVISPWLCLACPLIHPSMNDSFQQPPPHSSLCLPSPLIQIPHTTSLSIVPAQYHLSLCHLAPPNTICGWANI